MKVNVQIIKAMNPCKERFDGNFLVHYSNFDNNLEEFLSLNKITYEDKIWVCKKLLNKNQLVHWSVLCSQSVLQIYQNKYPNDNRIKDCIDYLITITDFSSLTNEQREKLKEVRAAASAAAYAASAAASAADAAAYAASAAASAADATYATYATYAAAYAASAADAAASAADAARKSQQELNLKFLLIASKL